jgi:transposase
LSCHLPRERVVIDPPQACECCGGNRLRKLGEEVTQTLECSPRQWKVVETVREKFSCRDCEKISQPPVPFHALARGWAGPSLLAMIMFQKFGQHQALSRQAERYALEGVPIALSTMADAVGSVCAALDPLLRRLEAHVMAAERLHADDVLVEQRDGEPAAILAFTMIGRRVQRVLARTPLAEFGADQLSPSQYRRPQTPWAIKFELTCEPLPVRSRLYTSVALARVSVGRLTQHWLVGVAVV